jgi:hypothetical protein
LPSSSALALAPSLRPPPPPPSPPPRFSRETVETPWGEEEARRLFRALTRSGKLFWLLARAVASRAARQCAAFYSRGWRPLALRQAFRDRARRVKKKGTPVD